MTTRAFARWSMLAFLFLTVSTSGRAGTQAPAGADRVPILAELFTSEGCHSCPPADRLLEVLSKEQPIANVYVVTVSEHVTYFDHLGWKDPFGSSRFTDRQNRYAFRFKLAGSYTPQLVIDGTTQPVGSDEGRVRRALADAARTPKPQLTVEALPTEDGALLAAVSGPGLQAGAVERPELAWIVTEDGLVVDVKRGENAKRTLRHSGVARVLTSRKVEPTTASGIVTATIRLRPEWKRENLRLVAFVQSTKTGRVLSVGWTQVAAATPFVSR